jgi:hypothetical protein
MFEARKFLARLPNRIAVAFICTNLTLLFELFVVYALPSGAETVCPVQPVLG